MTIAAGPEGVDLFDPFALDDPYPVYARLRATSPVHRVPNTDFFLVSTWDTVVDAAARTDDFSSNLRGVMVYGADGVPTRFSMDLDGAVEQVLATADGVAHRAHRKLVLQALGRRIRVLEDAVAEFTQAFWDEHLVDGRIDWVHALADRLPRPSSPAWSACPTRTFRGCSPGPTRASSSWADSRVATGSTSSSSPPSRSTPT